MSNRLFCFVIAVLIFSGLLFSCSPYGKILKRNPTRASDSLNLAKRCALTFPVSERTVYLSDTVTVTDFERAYKAENELMNTLYRLAECKDAKGTKVNLDSVKNEIRKGIKPPETKIVTNTEIVLQKDSAESFALRAELHICQTANVQKEAELKAQKEVNRELRKEKTKYKWLFIGACTAALGFVFFKIKSFFL